MFKHVAHTLKKRFETVPLQFRSIGAHHLLSKDVLAIFGPWICGTKI